MQELNYSFSGKQVNYYLDAPFSLVSEMIPPERCIIITDSVVNELHNEKFKGYNTIVIPAGEQHKQQSTVDYIIQRLIAFEADRKSFIIGVGGGVVTDISGYAAAVYMRGVKVGFVPTTVLAQVDAAVGGKNGIDAGIYKNLVGTIRQPDFILYDYSFLKTLPQEQWVNGFAEIIKHASIKDADMFRYLEEHDLHEFQSNHPLLADLIQQNVTIKSRVVEEDEFEQGDRKLLNFGHTLGHAIENDYLLLHGHAISIGMLAAAAISRKLNGFPVEDSVRLSKLLEKYGLPVTMEYDRQRAFNVLKMDKKRAGAGMNFVLLNEIGKAVVKSIPLVELEKIIQEL